MEVEMNVVSRYLRCSFCDKFFTRSFCLKRHLKTVHNHQQCVLKEGEILREFINFSEFVTWKEEEEKMTMAKYVRQRGSKINKDGDKVMYYHCCRSGTYKPRGKGLKSLKSRGSAKIGTTCPAVMKVRQSTENVIVQYFPKHENHETQLEHLRLSESDRTAIADVSSLHFDATDYQVPLRKQNCRDQRSTSLKQDTEPNLNLPSSKGKTNIVQCYRLANQNKQKEAKIIRNISHLRHTKENKQSKIIIIKMESSPKHHPALSSLSWLFGVWQSVEAEALYPSMVTLKFEEVVEFIPTMKPVVDYKSETWHPDTKLRMHCEKGFMRIDPESKQVALLVSHNFGLNEISEGPLKTKSLCLESKSISRMSFSKNAVTTKLVRQWHIEGEELFSTVLMQTTEQPLQIHLQCKYRRKT